MTWRMIGKPYTTAEMAAAIPTISQRFKVTESSLLNGAIHGIVLYNDPAFTAVSLELWADINALPSKLIATSLTSYTKAELLLVDDHAYKVAGFEFANVPLRAGAYYHLVLRATAYTGTSAAHIASRFSYPDPQYRTGLTLTAAKGAKHPFEYSLITAAL